MGRKAAGADATGVIRGSPGVGRGVLGYQQSRAAEDCITCIFVSPVLFWGGPVGYGLSGSAIILLLTTLDNCSRYGDMASIFTVMKLTVLLKYVALIAALPNVGYAVQPPPPPLGISQLRELIRRSDLVVVGKIKDVNEAEKTVDVKKETRINAILEIEKILKGVYGGANLVLEESYSTHCAMRPHHTPTTSKKHEKTIARERSGPIQYHGVYRKGARIIALLVPVKGAGTYQPLGSGTYDEYLCEFLIENGTVRTVNSSFEADIERYARSESGFTDLIVKLSERR